MSSSANKRLRRLEEFDNYVIELQVLDPILVIRARLHRATAYELRDGRVACRYNSRYFSWFTFFKSVDLLFDSALFA